MSKSIDTISADGPRKGWFAWIPSLFHRLGRAIAAPKKDRTGPINPGPAPALLMASRDIGRLVERTTARLADWQQRQDERRRLMVLDDHQLKDIGISRCDAEREYRKPFWRD